VLRIDIFITQTGELVVNEIEGIEAYIPAIGRNRALIDSIARSFLDDYWIHKFNTLVLHAIENIFKSNDEVEEVYISDDDVENTDEL
jgi:hypothetical protein